MPANGQQAPIVVSDQVTTPPFWTVIRYVLTALGTLLANKGILDADTANTLTGAALAIIPVIWGAWLAIQNKRSLIAAARSAHNDVAKVEPSVLP